MTEPSLARPRVESLFEDATVKVSRTVLGPGEEVPWHRHGEVADTFYGLAGRITILARDPADRITLAPGETARVERGRAHRVVNETEAPAAYLLIQGIGAYDFIPAAAEER